MRATNPNRMKAGNRKLILDIIRQRPISRAEIADMTQLTRASITMIVDDLLAQGLVREHATETRTVGRRPILLSIEKDARLILGVTVMRRRIEIGIVNLFGETLCHDALPHDISPQETVEAVHARLDAWREAYAIPEGKLMGVGISAPGPLNYLTGRILNPHGLKQWHDIPVAALFADALGLPAILERDTNALTLEEKYFGRARDVSNFMALQVDSGVGSGVVIRDRLYRGAGGLGNELGHASINFEGPLCQCGSRGCLEQYVAMPRLLGGTGFASWRDVMDAYGAAPRARALVDDLSRYLSAAIINAFNLFDLEQMLLLGDISYKPDEMLRRVNEQVQPRVIMRANHAIRPIQSSDTPYSVRTGAMSMLHTFYHERR